MCLNKRVRQRFLDLNLRFLQSIHETRYERLLFVEPICAGPDL